MTATALFAHCCHSAFSPTKENAPLFSRAPRLPLSISLLCARVARALHALRLKQRKKKSLINIAYSTGWDQSPYGFIIIFHNRQLTRTHAPHSILSIKTRTLLFSTKTLKTRARRVRRHIYLHLSLSCAPLDRMDQFGSQMSSTALSPRARARRAASRRRRARAAACARALSRARTCCAAAAAFSYAARFYCLRAHARLSAAKRSIAIQKLWYKNKNKKQQKQKQKSKPRRARARAHRAHRTRAAARAGVRRARAHRTLRAGMGFAISIGLRAEKLSKGFLCLLCHMSVSSLYALSISSISSLLTNIKKENAGWHWRQHHHPQLYVAEIKQPCNARCHSGFVYTEAAFSAVAGGWLL